jgi:hypothetical protein
VCAVAEGLVPGAAAAAEKVRFAGNEFDLERSFLSDDGIVGHVVVLPFVGGFACTSAMTARKPFVPAAP